MRCDCHGFVRADPWRTLYCFGFNHLLYNQIICIFSTKILKKSSPTGIRTQDPNIKSVVLQPAELQGNKKTNRLRCGADLTSFLDCGLNHSQLFHMGSYHIGQRLTTPSLLGTQHLTTSICLCATGRSRTDNMTLPLKQPTFPICPQWHYSIKLCLFIC